MRLERRRGWTVFFWVLAIGWIAVLFYFAGQSGEESGALSGDLTRWVLAHLKLIRIPEATLETLLRKTAHFGIFAMEGFLLNMAMLEALRGRYAIALPASTLACAGVAVLNELYQMLPGGRSCELRDMLIDSCGALLGVLFAALVFWIAESARIRVLYRRSLGR